MEQNFRREGEKLAGLHSEGVLCILGSTLHTEMVNAHVLLWLYMPSLLGHGNVKNHTGLSGNMSTRNR